MHCYIQETRTRLVLRIEATNVGKGAVGLEQHRNAVQLVVSGMKDMTRHITPSHRKTCQTPR